MSLDRGKTIINTTQATSGVSLSGGRSDGIRSQDVGTLMTKILYGARAAVFALLMVIVACGQNYEHEREPNDSFSGANALPAGRPLQGFLARQDDKDYYRLRIETRSVVDIELSAIKGVNSAFEIWKGDGTPVLLKRIDDTRKSSSERLANLFCAPGTYYLVVMHGERDTPAGNSENPYVLKYNTRDFDGEEKEPNDSLSAANGITVGEEIKGYFSPAINRLNEKGESSLREEDWYVFNAELDASRPRIFTITLSGVTGVNSVLALYDSRRNLIAQSDSKGQGEGEALRDIGISTEGKYYIMVASKSFESNHETPYRLRISAGAYDETMELEPNNDIDHATTMPGRTVEGKIAAEGDVDFFRYAEGKGRSFCSIELVPPESLDLVMTIIGKTRQKLFEVDNGGPGEREIFPNALLDPGFFIMVSAKRGQSDKKSTYALSVSSFAFSENYEVEPNDTKETANRIRKKIIKGYISKKHDIDCFLLEYGRRIKATIEIEGVPDASLKISITDPAGYEIRSEDLNGDKRLSITEMIDGRAYLIIEAAQESYDQPYQVKIRED
jgi:hypothetical protein